MTERRRPSKKVTVGTHLAQDRMLQEISRCLEDIFTLAGEDARNEKAAGGTAGRPGSIMKLAEGALSLLRSLSCFRSAEGVPEKSPPFSICSVCLSAAGKASADRKTPPSRWKSTRRFRSSLKETFPGWSTCWKKPSKKPQEQERKGRRFPCTPWSGGTFPGH